MNILPKKNWHVRTKENIARVRRDEAQAAEEEREMERRRKLAEQEARTGLLRLRAREKLGLPAPDQNEVNGKEEDTKVGFDATDGEVESLTNSAGHVNFFQNIEKGEKMKEGNEENAAEKKKEQEEYEKKVGYLTYLGQDTEELTGDKVWWRKLPERHDPDQDTGPVKDVASKQKDFLDPLQHLKQKLGCDTDNLSLKRHQNATNVKSIKHEKVPENKFKRKRSSSSESSEDERRKKKQKAEKKHKRDAKKKKKDRKSSKSKKSKSKKKKRRKSSSSSEDSSSSDEDKKKKAAKLNLEKLRRERLEREKKERERSNVLLYGEPKKDKEKEKGSAPQLKASYNSQFNPEIARQNKLDPNKKYWLQ